MTWAAQWPQPQVTFALEDCRHLTRRLEADLLRAGHRVVRVPTRLMAAARRAGRSRASPTRSTRGGRAGRVTPARLPVADLDGPTRQVKLLADYRADLVPSGPASTGCAGTCTQLDPEPAVPARGLRRYKMIDDLAARLAGFDGSWPGWPGNWWPGAAS